MINRKSKPLPLLIIIISALSSCTPEFGGGSSAASSSFSSSAASFSSSSAIPSSSAASSFDDGTVPAGYSLKWNDEFDGDALKSNNWTPQIGDGSDYGITGWGNGEAENYQSDDATVSDGALHIAAVKDSTTYRNARYQYTSGRIRSNGKVSTAYGYIEAKIKLPAVQGMWPAFWMLPETSYANKGWPTSGELDIMEAKGRVPMVVGGTTHSANGSYADAYHTESTTLDSSIEEWHIYGVLWTDSEIDFSADGVVYNRVSRATWVNDCDLYDGGPAPFNKPFYLIFNLAVGGQYDSYLLPPSAFESAEMLVDYVRIYQA